MGHRRVFVMRGTACLTGVHAQRILRSVCTNTSDVSITASVFCLKTVRIIGYPQRTPAKNLVRLRGYAARALLFKASLA